VLLCFCKLLWESVFENYVGNYLWHVQVIDNPTLWLSFVLFSPDMSCFSTETFYAGGVFFFKICNIIQVFDYLFFLEDRTLPN